MTTANAICTTAAPTQGGRPTEEPLGSTSPEFWIAMLAHELRGPLNSVTFALDLLEPAVEAHPEAGLTQRVLRRAIGHMADVINDVLDFARLGRGRVKITRQPVDLRCVVSLAIEIARPMLVQKQHTLVVQLPTDTSVVYAHACRLQQIIANLLTNAAKYTEPGGRITLSAALVNGSLLMNVRDNGIGIDARFLPHVFEPFRRAQSGVGSADGLGLGLSLVKSLVELHGGTVTAHSDGPGLGAVFVVSMPVAQPRELSLVV